jgi:hypothetical protein
MRAKDWMHNVARIEPVPRPGPVPGGAVAAEPAEEIEEDVHPSKAYGGLWSRRDKAYTVEFRFLDPRRADEALDYHYLPRVQWRKSTGEIVLPCDALGLTVVIRGLNLGELKERLRQHLVTWVQEQGDDPVRVRQTQDEARAAGRELVLVQEIRFEEHGPPAAPPA